MPAPTTAFTLAWNPGETSLSSALSTGEQRVEKGYWIGGNREIITFSWSLSLILTPLTEEPENVQYWVELQYR